MREEGYSMTLPSCRRFMALLLGACAALLRAGLAAAQEPNPTDEERRDAYCIDYYNDPKAPQVSREEASLGQNPWLVAMSSEAFLTGARDGDAAAQRGVGPGARLDVDVPVIWVVKSPGTLTGFSLGGTGEAFWVNDGTFAIGGELRLGVARRRMEVAWSSFSDECRKKRTDIVLDFVRWRLAGLTDRTVSSHPTTFVSSIGLANLRVRKTFSTWGWDLTGSVLDFRLAPPFQWGISGRALVDMRHVLVSLAAGAHVAPVGGWVVVGLGYGFEI